VQHPVAHVGAVPLAPAEALGGGDVLPGDDLRGHLVQPFQAAVLVAGQGQRIGPDPAARGPRGGRRVEQHRKVQLAGDRRVDHERGRPARHDHVEGERRALGAGEGLAPFSSFGSTRSASAR